MTVINDRAKLVFKWPMILSDIIIMMLVLFVSLQTLPEEQLHGLEDIKIGLFLLLLVSFFFSSVFIKLKQDIQYASKVAVIGITIRRTIVIYLIYTLFLALCYKTIPRHLLVWCFFSTAVLLSVWHFLSFLWLKSRNSSGKNSKKVVFVGLDDTSIRLFNELKYTPFLSGCKPLGFFSSRGNTELRDKINLLGSTDDFFVWIQDNNADIVFCSLPPTMFQSVIKRIIRICDDRFIEFFFVPSMEGYPERTMTIDRIGDVNVIKLREEPMNSILGRIYRRIFGVIVSGLFLCTLFPLIFLFVAIGIKISSPGPVFFKQKRTGYNGKSFTMYKFRSMKVNDTADTIQATESDPRKTKFGDFLRRTSIDELPQFINVFIGDMNVVGPRPHMEHHTEFYSSLIDTYMVRHWAKPGITGWAQVTGCRGETKEVSQMEERVKRDIWYIEHWTPLLDTVIIFRTIGHILSGSDSHAY